MNHLMQPLFAAGEGFWNLIGRLLGIENLRSFERLDLSLAAPWAQYRGAAAWVFFGCVLLAVLAYFFYSHYQTRGPWKTRMLLAGLRGASLVLVFLILFEPTLVAHYVSNPRPQLWVVFDGSESMQLKDEFPASERTKLAEAVGISPGSDDKLSRADYIKALLIKKDNNLLTKLSEKFRLRAFLFDRADGVRSIELSDSPDAPVDPARAVAQLSTDGQVTALGAAFNDLARRHSAGHLAGVLVFSDFDQNAGPPPLAAAEKLGVPVYTVGVGPVEAVDLEVDLQAPLVMKKAETSTVVAILRPRGLTGKSVNVKVFARKATEGGKPESAAITPIGEKMVTLGTDSLPVDFPFTPDDTGRFALVAEVDKVEGETIDQNNHAERDVTIRDDFLRLMFVEYEPTWEWRFIKEVFHRDKLVGTRGFRTFLRSADPKVRQSNELFLPTLTPKRSDFFANDVIFLGDMPASTLSTRFCEMTREFVEKFGGGLVVMAGPRFGPGQLAQTPLADMLPVEVDLDARVRDDRDRDSEGERGFQLRRTLEADQYDFMRLGNDAVENEKGWANLSRIPWYQPVARPRNGATVLAEIPNHTCVDGVTPQPIIAIRRLGKGEVIYIGFDETWRLRRKYGELYYRKFWGQMIHRLGLSHALGSQKRFVVETDRQHYQSDDRVLLTVEAYDANFEPLDAEKLPDRKLQAEMIVPSADGDSGPGEVQKISISQLREGVFEARVPVLKRGEHRIRVADPITSEYSEVVFQVTSRSAEGRSAVRKVDLERQIAQTTGGKDYDLETVQKFPEEVKLPQTNETLVQNLPLWNTYLCFFAVVLLLLSEWLIRKLVHLP